MSHRRVKALGFDDDYEEEEEHFEEDEEGGNEMSAEDQELMRYGTIKVKEGLGAEISATDKEIQDSLWYYFFDVDKSVAYLKKLQAPPAQKKNKVKSESRFDQAAKAAQTDVNPSEGEVTKPYPDIILQGTTTSPTAVDFFADVPWGNVPLHRMANIHVEPRFTRGGLLGGSAKPSKLAALAAARKKKDEDRQILAQSSQSDRSISLLDRLSTNKEIVADKVKATSVKRVSTEQPTPVRMPSRQRKEPSPSLKTPIAPQHSGSVTSDSTAESLESLRARPSIFAQTIFGQRNPSSGGGVELEFQNMNLDRSAVPKVGSAFTFPYIRDPEFASRNPFLGPSPDDVVLRAQSKGVKASTRGKSKPPPDTNGITEDVGTLSLKEASSPKHKNLNVLEEFRKANMKVSASFVVAGHVDHGKSTLMGRLLYDSGRVDEAAMERLRRDSKKIGKSSFALAWVMDATPDERERGVTVDIATNHFETENTRFTILDAPGHQDFIPNMIAGASQADFAVLVVDSSTNSFESGLRGQTREHALLVRSMGIQKLIVAVNKMDMVQWSQDRFIEIQQQMTRFLEVAGFKENSISVIPCAGLTGDNIVRKPSHPEASWYTGPTLVEELDSAEPTKRALEKPLRLTVSEVFRTSPNNPISISGKLDAGSLQVGDIIKVMPSGESATIKSLEADGEVANWAVAGQITILNLADIDPVHLKYGDIVCHPQNAIKNVKSFTIKILAMDHVMPMFVEVHRGPMHVPGKITTLVETLDKTSGVVLRKKPKVVQPGAVARVIVELGSEMPLEAPAKVILRADGKTVAAGLLE